VAFDAYISSTDKGGVKTTHLSSAGAISAAMLYGVWDKTSESCRILCTTSADAESELATLRQHCGDNGRFCVITVPR